VIGEWLVVSKEWSDEKRERNSRKYKMRRNEEKKQEDLARKKTTEKIRRIRARVSVCYTSIYIKNRSTATIRDLFSSKEPCRICGRLCRSQHVGFL